MVNKGLHNPARIQEICMKDDDDGGCGVSFLSLIKSGGKKKKKEAMAEIKKPLQGDLKITLIQLQQECGACFTQSAAQCHYCNSH